MGIYTVRINEMSVVFTRKRIKLILKFKFGIKLILKFKFGMDY